MRSCRFFYTVRISCVCLGKTKTRKIKLFISPACFISSWRLFFPLFAFPKLTRRKFWWLYTRICVALGKETKEKKKVRTISRRAYNINKMSNFSCLLVRIRVSYVGCVSYHFCSLLFIYSKALEPRVSFTRRRSQYLPPIYFCFFIFFTSCGNCRVLASNNNLLTRAFIVFRFSSTTPTFQFYSFWGMRPGVINFSRYDRIYGKKIYGKSSLRSGTRSDELLGMVLLFLRRN